MLVGFSPEQGPPPRINGEFYEPPPRERPSDGFLKDSINAAEKRAAEATEAAETWKEVQEGARLVKETAKWTGKAPLPHPGWKAGNKAVQYGAMAVEQAAKEMARAKAREAAQAKADAEVIREIERAVDRVGRMTDRARREMTREFDRLEKLSRTA